MIFSGYCRGAVAADGRIDAGDMILSVCAYTNTFIVQQMQKIYTLNCYSLLYCGVCMVIVLLCYSCMNLASVTFNLLHKWICGRFTFGVSFVALGVMYSLTLFMYIHR